MFRGEVTSGANNAPSRAQLFTGRLMSLAPELLGQAFGYLDAGKDQAALRNTCRHAADAFSLAVRNEWLIGAAGTFDEGTTDVNDPKTRWFPLAVRSEPSTLGFSRSMECVAISLPCVPAASRESVVADPSLLGPSRAVVFLATDGSIDVLENVCLKQGRCLEHLRLVGFQQLQSVRHIGFECANLKQVVLPPELPLLRRMGDLCFNCPVLTSAVLPAQLAQLTRLGNVFTGCIALGATEPLSLPDMPELRRVDDVFALCEGAVDVTIPDLPELTRSGTWFYSCTALERVRFGAMPKLVTSGLWLPDCESLVSVELPPTMPVAKNTGPFLTNAGQKLQHLRVPQFRRRQITKGWRAAESAWFEGVQGQIPAVARAAVEAAMAPLPPLRKVEEDHGRWKREVLVADDLPDV